MYEAQNKGMILANRRRVNMKSNAAGENSECETEKLKNSVASCFKDTLLTASTG